MYAVPLRERLIPTGFTLPYKMLIQIEDIVDNKRLFPSKSAFVREAIEEKINKINNGHKQLENQK